MLKKLLRYATNVELTKQKDIENEIEMKNLKEIEMKKQNVLLSVYSDMRISTSENKDETYKDFGIIHKCKAVAISKLSEKISDIANIFGSSGYDGEIFDKARNLCLVKLTETLDDLTFLNPQFIYKISNLKNRIYFY